MVERVEGNTGGRVHDSISVFFPFYNDENTIRPLAEQALEILTRRCEDFEIILVNDGSPDGTRAIADALAAEHPGVIRAVHHEKNRGYGGALRTGFKTAGKKWVFYTDGDAQYDLRDFETFLDHIGEADVINGYKKKRGDGMHRAVIGRLYYWTTRTLFGIRMKDIDCDFRLMRREIFDNIDLYSDSGVICVELMKKVQDAGYTMTEYPVTHLPRPFGNSQFFRLSRVLHVGLQLTGLFFGLGLKLSGKHRCKKIKK